MYLLNERLISHYYVAQVSLMKYDKVVCQVIHSGYCHTLVF